MDERFSKTEYAVEADSFARQALWEKFSIQTLYKTRYNVINWIEDSGILKQVGSINDRPITVEFIWGKLNGCLIMFYNPTSQLVDWVMVEKWLDKNCKAPRCDANNFSDVYQYVTK